MTDLSAIATGDFEKHPAVWFDAEDTVVKGTILSSRIADIKAIEPDKPPRSTLIIEIEIDAAGTTAKCAPGDDADPNDSVWTLFCKPAAMRAIATAVKAKGGTSLLDGGRIAVQRGADAVDRKKKGWSAPHSFTAAYEPPASGLDLSTVAAPAPAASLL